MWKVSYSFIFENPDEFIKIFDLLKMQKEVKSIEMNVKSMGDNKNE
jgi:hypothetical protein